MYRYIFKNSFNNRKKFKCENFYYSFKSSNNTWRSRENISLKLHTQECRRVQAHNMSFLNVGEEKL